MTQTTALVLENPQQLSLRQLLLAEPQAGDVFQTVDRGADGVRDLGVPLRRHPTPALR